MESSFKEIVKTQLILMAKEYFKLINKSVILKCDDFIYQKIYLIKFTKTNFLHLTGVSTCLSANDFFNKCYESAISVDDFDYKNISQKNIIKSKLQCLPYLATIFNSSLQVQEQFSKNVVSCKIAASNNSCTIGFAGGKKCVYPKTILSKNHLDISKPIVIVKPVIINN